MQISELIDRCKAGDETAVELFVERHTSQVYRLACSVLDDPIEAADAAQDALVSALMALNTYNGKSALSTWVYTVALNECRSRLRRRRIRTKLRFVLASIRRTEIQNLPGPEEDLLRSEEDRRVWTAIQTLGDLHRIPVILRYYQELSVREIAEILGLSEGTVHSRLNTARLRLNSLLSEQSSQTRQCCLPGGVNE